ncbi:hypothetical protein AM587_10009559 [Phytophthora nicotianae]|uniref:Uncharacterized protein n=1 Tax=Phytophthora nicotianae TaxID=4792 RepID=A0A0W8C1M2_PHYNI|nr:hypothetical protein AM587_10009559 [Phytophthora nicotianae]
MLLICCLLPLLALLLSPALGKQCAHFSQDDLLSRLEYRVPKCLGPSVSSSALSTLTERFVANEFDRRQPLALVLFSNSSDLLHSLTGALASSLFGISRSPHTVQSVDFQALIEPSRTSNYEIKQRLRSALATPLGSCPERSLFVLDNVQALDDAALPVLDVFLDPLNGKRAQFQHYDESKASRVFDCTNSIFLFLYKIAANNSPLDGTIEEFTPQAFVGRLTDAIAVFPPDEDDSTGTSYDVFKQSREWRQMCDLQANYEEDEAGGNEIITASTLSIVAENVAAATPVISGAIVMMSIPAYLLILTRAKRWNEETTKQRGHIHRRRNSGSSGSARRKRRKTRK